MEHPGLLSWANSVRLTMASDPGRQLFKDQVQMHGFLFLDDYLDNIVSGAKQDPLIELVKTPGRKKAIARKPKLMSKLGNVIVSEDGDENVAPMSGLQKILFSPQANMSCGPDLDKPQKSEGSSGNDKSQRAALLPVQPADNNLANPAILSPSPLEPQPLVEVPNANPEHNDLSIIAEDEEPSEGSRTSTFESKEGDIKSPILVQELPPPLEESIGKSTSPLPPNTLSCESDIASTSSMDTFHPIPLDSPAECSITPMDDAQPSEPEPMIVVDDRGPSPKSRLSSDMQDHPMADSPEDTMFIALKDKPIMQHSFPTLPEPMPLRKSMRPARDPSMNAVMQGAATPGAVGGKRSSWLAKAREVKMLETGKKGHITAMPTLTSTYEALPPLMQGTKRKSGDMLETPEVRTREEERQQKVAKIVEGEIAPRKSKEKVIEQETTTMEEPTARSTIPQTEPSLAIDFSQEGVLDRLKKTVEGLGVRVGMGKSLGGGAATALAEARAAAEARLAERDRKDEERTIALGVATSKELLVPSSSTTQLSEGRLSMSDLFPMDSRVKEKHKAPQKVFHKESAFPREEDITRMSTSTTPPHSPPQNISFIQPSSTVFSKPPPVFVPPVPAPSTNKPTSQTKGFAFHPPSPPKYNALSSMGFSPRLLSSSSPKGKSAMPLTAHSTLESVRSEKVFDHDDSPAWMPSTQDTEYTSTYESQNQAQTQICDEDDSWPVDEKLAAGVQWTYGASKEDSMTWSTLPSQSQRADTGPATKTSPIREESVLDTVEKSHQIPGAFDEVDMDIEEDLIPRDEELEEIVLGSKPYTSLSKTELPRSQSVMSLASSESSQSQAGFFGQASKLISSALGTSKKKQPEVKKVLQMAAAAAKKQQEEADKKATRLKEMESRRQQAIQRKAEEERAKAMEEERKVKEETERRKKEREEYTDKKPLKPMANKKDDDTMKRRKLEAEKKAEVKKPSVLIGKVHLKSALKQPGASSSTAYGSSQQSVASSSTAAAEPSILYKSKTVVTQKMVVDDDISQPSQLMQSQMAARAKAQIDASKPIIPSESIELPDINSEYSDSDDEDRKRTFDPPEWAQSPELRQALEMQSTINPDDIFGVVRPLRMEEIFKTRTSRFRARTSSANWTGTDRLTIQEELEYARRMGFK